MNFHTKAQRATISDMRKTKNTMSLNIYLQYPILPLESSKKYPILSFVLVENLCDIRPGQTFGIGIYTQMFPFLVYSYFLHDKLAAIKKY